MLATASTRIRKAHCRVGRITRLVSSPRKRGRVLAEKPRPGATLRGGTKIQLIVGKGPRN
jgi:beta-lactam-binding protein with PASTA domain